MVSGASLETKTVEDFEKKLAAQQKKISDLEDAGKKASALKALIGLGSAVVGALAAFGALYATTKTELGIWKTIKDSHLESVSGGEAYNHNSIQLPSVDEIRAALELPDWNSFATKDEIPTVADLVPSGSAICYFGKSIPDGWELANSTAKWPDSNWLQVSLHGSPLPNLNSGRLPLGTVDIGKVGDSNEATSLDLPKLNLTSRDGSINVADVNKTIGYSDRTMAILNNQGKLINEGVLSTTGENYGKLKHTGKKSTMKYLDSQVSSITLPERAILIDSSNLPSVYCRWIIKTS